MHNKQIVFLYQLHFIACNFNYVFCNEFSRKKSYRSVLLYPPANKVVGVSTWRNINLYCYTPLQTKYWGCIHEGITLYCYTPCKQSSGGVYMKESLCTVIPPANKVVGVSTWRNHPVLLYPPCKQSSWGVYMKESPCTVIPPANKVLGVSTWRNHPVLLYPLQTKYWGCIHEGINLLVCMSVHKKVQFFLKLWINTDETLHKCSI